MWVEPFLEATVRSATPIALAATGELVAQRSGVINIGLEGAIVCGALAAFVAGGSFGPYAGFVAGGGAGLVIALVFAAFVLVARADQIITGAAISMLGLGLTATIHRVLFSDTVVVEPVPLLPTAGMPLLSEIPLMGAALFSQGLPTLLAVVAIPLIALFLYRTAGGLALRAVGEHPAAAVAAGHRPAALQLAAIAFGGIMAGLAGATLVVAQTGAFADGISAGRGFIAIAVVALGRWTPAGVALGALLFGAASALQFLLQALGLSVSYNLMLAVPYVLTLVALCLVRGRSSAPVALGHPLRD